MILEGQHRIPVTLLEAVDAVDADPIYALYWIDVEPTDLVSQWRNKLAETTIKLVTDFTENFPNSLSKARMQVGKPSYYPRRRPQDSELDTNKTLRQLFKLFQVVDNDHYPAYFTHKGQEYTLKIFPRQLTKD
jgi:methionyl-tRNA formyltransferase